MAAEVQASEIPKIPRKRKPKHNKASKARKKSKSECYQEPKEVKRLNRRKMKKLFKKRAKNYNSDDDEEEPRRRAGDLGAQPHCVDEQAARDSSEEDGEAEALDVGGEHGDEGDGGSEDEDHGSKDEITKFTEGCRAFRVSFLKIMKKNISKDPLGPVLSGQKKLIAEKLAEEEAEKKVKAEAKKEKWLKREKGHVKPPNFLDTKEKFLISVATKGVVKLFNAVNKAQHAQKGLNPARSKDAKVLGKRRKEAFLSELQKSSSGSMPFNSAKGAKSVQEEKDEPGWAPLRNDYMLTDAKLKDWDKMADDPGSAVPEEIPLTDSSSDDE